jgi:hypothetical protein
MRAVRSSILLAALLLAGACGRNSQMSDWQPAPSDQTVTIAVTNSNPSDVNVYAVQGGQRFRLGTVTTSQTQTFTAPVTVAVDGSLRLQVEPIGGPNGWITPSILVSPGQQVKLDVMPILRTSAYSVQ